MANTIDDIYTKATNAEIPEEETVELGVEIKQFQDEEGQPFYAKTHMDAIDGFEEYTEGLTQLAFLIGDYVSDSGWIEYDYDKPNGVTINGLYASDGFKCGIREIVLNPYKFGNGNQVRIKMIRVNLKKFLHTQQVALLPSGFMNTTQVFYSRSGSGKQPVMIEVRKSGQVFVYLDKADQAAAPDTNWIYAQHTWVE